MIEGLILLPNALHPLVDSNELLPPILLDIVPTLSGIIAESEKGARIFLKRFTFNKHKTFRDLPIHLLNEHTSLEEVETLLMLLKKGNNWGLISDCGLPVIADPGAKLVHLAHKENIPVYAYPGPSSIILALMLSGLPGQTFTFHGYLPRSLLLLKKKIGLIQRLQDQTHIFIEVPYRTVKLFQVLTTELKDDFILCAAANLTLPRQEVVVKKIKVWKKENFSNWNKKPVVFVVGKHITSF